MMIMIMMNAHLHMRCHPDRLTIKINKRQDRLSDFVLQTPGARTVAGGPLPARGRQAPDVDINKFNQISNNTNDNTNNNNNNESDNNDNNNSKHANNNNTNNNRCTY